MTAAPRRSDKGGCVRVPGAGARGSSAQGPTLTPGPVTGGDMHSEEAVSPCCSNLLLLESLAQSSVIQLYCSSAGRFGLLRCNSEQPGQSLAAITDHTPAGSALHQPATARAAQRPGAEGSWIFNGTAFNWENVLPGLFKPPRDQNGWQGISSPE